MNVYLVNDCFYWPDSGLHHFGCKAIMDSLTRRIQAKGHNIIAVEKRPEGPKHEWIARADMVIVNGEGTFRDEKRNWEPGRHDRMFTGMMMAKEMGKRVYLVNATWSNMTGRWGPLLRSLDGISVREPASQDQIRLQYGADSTVHPDESYFLPVPRIMQDFEPVYYGDIYPHNFIGTPRNYGKPMRLTQKPWGTVVNALRHSGLYVTGQHHGVYAACKARCPFAAVQVNGHKLTGLFKWAGVEIPLAMNTTELDEIALWAKTPAAEVQFDKLFNFLEQQKPWPIP